MIDESLRQLLADAYVMYYQAHSSHWNVTGDSFPYFHKFFGDIYEDVYDSLDNIAENLRKIEEFTPLTLVDIVDIARIKGVISSTEGGVMSRELYLTNEVVLEDLRDAFAQAQGNEGLRNYLAERLDQHAKWSWQLRVTSV